ncbi:MAG TPA: LLM class F420-dependent oxidoreductase [Acidimicrobiales bacterium]|nr:LLM class F420-dependent oxidoreductase [Acidimicrobiales bacterium]
MIPPRPFRFAAQIDGAPSAKEWTEAARQAEDLGFSSLTMPDHFGDQLAPVPALMAAADATTTLRIGTLVFDNDYKHPLVLAKEAATLDLLSDGRLELGLGAGWMRSDYEQSGIAYDPPAVRVDRFVEGIAVIKGLMADGPFSFSGEHYTISGHDGLPKPVQRPHPPIIIGGGGRRVLSIAAREANIVSVNPDLREGLGGAETAPNTVPAMTTTKIGWVKEAAGERFDELELNVLIGFCMITDNPMPIAEAMAPAFGGISPEEALHVPICLVGSLDFMVDELQRRRDEWGFSYIGLEGDWRALAPIVSRLAGT